MRIVLFTTGFFEYVVCLANALSSTKNEIHLLISDTVEQETLDQVSDQVHIHPFTNVNYVSNRQNIKMALRLIKTIRKINPDIVHTQSYGHPWFNLILKYSGQFKFINTVHDPSPHSGDQTSLRGLSRYKNKFKTLNKKTDLVFVHGESLKKDFATKYNFPKHKIVCIPHGEFSIYKNYSNLVNADVSNHILFFGRIWDYKGLDIFIEAGKKTLESHPNAQFVIAGKGEDFNKYTKQIKGHESSFVVKNYRIPLTEVSPLFESALFVVLPYKDATQSGVIPLAFAHSKTVIATGVGSLPEIVTSSRDGILIPPNDIDALAYQMNWLLEHPDERQKMEIEAKKTADTKLSWKHIADQHLSHYES